MSIQTRRDSLGQKNISRYSSFKGVAFLYLSFYSTIVQTVYFFEVDFHDIKTKNLNNNSNNILLLQFKFFKLS
jgi:hypothetical protein